MGSYLGAVWRCRYFWWSLVKIDLKNAVSAFHARLLMLVHPRR